MQNNNLTGDQIDALYAQHFGESKSAKNDESPSFLSNLARQGYQGATLGLGPKLLAGGAALGAKAAGYLGEKSTRDVSLSELYKMGLDIERQKLNKGQEQYPISSIASQIGSSLPTGGSVLKGLGLAGKGIGNAVKGGASLGALEGLGRTEDLANTSQGISDATTGAALGGVLPVGLAGVGKGMQKVSNLASPILKGGKQVISNFLTPSEQKAINLFKNNLATEGLSASDALKQLEDTGLDVVDIVDPRFKAKQNAIRFLQDKQTIKNIADTSLDKLEETSRSLQKEVSDMLSTKKIDNEQAADILGRNAKKIIDNQIEARRIASIPLYEEGIKGKIRPNQIVVKDLTPEQAANLSIDPSVIESQSMSGNPIHLTATEFLQSPIVKKAIETARSQSEQFAKTPGGFIYKDIANPRYSNDSLKVLNATDNVLTDMIGNPQLVNQSEVAALKMVKSGLQTLLDDANPILKKARETWSRDSKTLKEIENSSVGKIAKLYNTNKTDDLIKRSNDILLLSPERISTIRAQNPQEFDSLLRNSFENKLETIVPEAPKAFTKAIFGKDGGSSLKAALGQNAQVFNGIKKLTQTLDAVADRQKLTSKANFLANDLTESDIGSTAKNNIGDIIVRPALALYRHLVKGEDPEMRRLYVEYMFTQKGQNLLKDLARAESKIKQASILDTMMQDISKIPNIAQPQKITGLTTAVGMGLEPNQ